MPSKAEYWRNPEKHRAATREYARSHTDWKREANRAWIAKKRETDPDFKKRERDASRRYQLRLTPDQRAERADYQRAWFAANPTYSRDKQAADHKLHPTKRMAESAKVRARSLGVPFDLDWREIEMPEKCPVLGTPFSTGYYRQTARSPSLDRIIPELGYVKGNVRVISHGANAIKKNKNLSQLRQAAEVLRLRLERTMAVVAYLERELG